MLVKFYAATVLAAISNTDYEGEISKKGDEVIIRTVPSITIKDYIKGQKLTYETPESAAISLLIDKGKYWAFVVDSIDKYQSDINLMDRFSADAGEQLKITVDTQVLGAVYADAHAKNKGAAAGAISGNINLGATGSPLAVTKVSVLEVLVDCGQALDEQNAPETGRWIVIPAWLASMIKKSDLKDASLTGDGVSVMRNGRLGMIDRFTLYSSNNLANTVDGAVTATNCIFGTSQATTFASQIVETETLKAESTFGDMVRGLNVYGFKVIKPEALGHLYAYKA